MSDKFKDCWQHFGNWLKDYRHFNCSGKDNISSMNLKRWICSSKHIFKHYLFSLGMLNENCSILQLTYMLYCWWHEEQRKRWKCKQSGKRGLRCYYYHLHTYFFCGRVQFLFHSERVIAKATLANRFWYDLRETIYLIMRNSICSIFILCKLLTGLTVMEFPSRKGTWCSGSRDLWECCCTTAAD